MKPPIFIDTSYFLALLNKRDKYHQAALQATRNYPPPFVTTEAILLEVGDALAKPPRRSLAIRALRQIRADNNIKIVPITSDLFAEALNLYQGREDKGWGLTDCVSFVVMAQFKMTQSLTADKHFLQAGFLPLLPLS